MSLNRSESIQPQTKETYPNIYRRICMRMNGMDHIDLLQPIGKMDHDDRLINFLELFSDLTCNDIGTKVREVYSEHIYFSDTLKVIDDLDELANYLEATGNHLEYSRIIFDRVFQIGDEYFIQWYMKTGFNLLGRALQTKSIGMSHIRLDEEGKVILHQDFWDNTEGLFRHIPLIKLFYKQFKRRV